MIIDTRGREQRKRGEEEMKREEEEKGEKEEKEETGKEEEEKEERGKEEEEKEERGKEGEEKLVEEHCSELWNQIKDAAVMDGAELSNAFLDHLQSKGDHLEGEVRNLSQRSEALAANAQLRLCSVWTALGELKRKKREMEAGEDWGCVHLHHPQSVHQIIGQFRRWLNQTEKQLAHIKTRVPHSRNSMGMLRELEKEQVALQAQIETEGRARHQQLCNSQILRTKQRQNCAAREERESEQLEQRYLALWLASLESQELIQHFVEGLGKKCPGSWPDSELEEPEAEEEGPNPKRRKINDEELEQYMENNQCPEETMLPEGKELGGSEEEMVAETGRHLLTDIGYSSGENTSVHECGSGGGSGKGKDDAMSEEQMERQFVLTTENNELEKSFYRTVPLDEFGMTDLDTDEGATWTRSSYWAQKFLDQVEKGTPGGGAIELTDSLIVHVDGPESREKLNDFEEVMDLIGGGTATNRRTADHLTPGHRFEPFSEDECESQSTDAEGGRARHHVGMPMSRKRTLAKGIIASPAAEGKTRKSARGTGRRRWAMRKTRSSVEGTKFAEGTRRPAEGWPSFSSDYEWDDEEYGGTRRGHADEEEAEVLPDIADESILMRASRKKALCAFREGLRRAAAESGHVSVRLQELLALVDKSLGGVDSAAFLLAEMNSTFLALSRLCQQLERKMGEGKDWREERREEEESNRMEQYQKGMESELMLCHERMNALETTCNNLSLLLGTHLSDVGDGGGICAPSAEKDYLAQFAKECHRIQEELQKLKARFGEKFVFCSVKLEGAGGWCGEEEKGNNRRRSKGPAQSADNSAQTPPTIVRPPPSSNSFWRSYLLLCVIGLIASFGTLLLATSRDGTDWRWTFGPQLNYEDGAPPI